ncbi:MAG TPA: hypothetical protein VFQ04_09685, partial [Actinomycetes bacterium]|nr:hypothetical protein [Actinomycetes bacterium]
PGGGPARAGRGAGRGRAGAAVPVPPPLPRPGEPELERPVRGHWDGPVRPQASEIAWGAFLTLDELDTRLEEWPFCPDGLEVFRRWQAGGY